jgi:hypothetical protein
VAQTIPVLTRVEPATRDRFAELARRNHRTFSGELRVAIERHLDDGDETAVGLQRPDDAELVANGRARGGGSIPTERSAR